MNNKLLDNRLPYLRSLCGSIPVTVVAIPVVVFSSVLASSSFNRTLSAIYLIFCGVQLQPALFPAPSIYSTSAAKGVFPSWVFQNWMVICDLLFAT
jgi:hypothetical protein